MQGKSSIEQALREARTVLEQQIQEISSMKHEAALARDRSAAFKTIITKLESSLEKTESERNSNAEKLQAMEVTRVMITEQKTAAEQDRDRIAEQLHAEVERRTEAIAGFKQLQTKLSLALERLRAARTEADTLSTKCTELEENIEDLKRAKEVITLEAKANAGAANEVKHVERRATDAEEKMNEIKEQLDGTRADLKTAKAKFVTTKVNIAKLQKTNGEMAQALAEIKARTEVLESTLESAQKENKEKERARARLAVGLARATQELQACEDRVIETIAERERSETEARSQLQRSENEGRRARENADAKFAAAAAEWEAEVSRLKSNFQSQKSTSQSTISTMQTRIAETELQLTSCKSTLVASEKENKDALRRLAAVTSELEVCRTNFTATKENMNTANQQSMQLNEKMSAMTKAFELIKSEKAKMEQQFNATALSLRRTEGVLEDMKTAKDREIAENMSRWKASERAKKQAMANVAALKVAAHHESQKHDTELRALEDKSSDTERRLTRRAQGAEQERDMSLARLRESDDSLKRCEDELQRVSEEYRASNAKAYGFEQSFRNSELSLTKLTSEHEALQSRCSSVEQEKRLEEGKREELERRMREAEGALSQQARALEVSTARVAELSKRMEVSTRTLDKTQQSLDANRRELDEQRQAMNRQEDDLSATMAREQELSRRLAESEKANTKEKRALASAKKREGSLIQELESLRAHEQDVSQKLAHTAANLKQAEAVASREVKTAEAARAELASKIQLLSESTRRAEVLSAQVESSTKTADDMARHLDESAIRAVHTTSALTAALAGKERENAALRVEVERYVMI